jgi:endonuclease/exonuclease/phosphatase family metal-dependent hydrolase
VAPFARHHPSKEALVKPFIPFALLAAVLLAACSEPASAPDLRADNEVATAFSVMTRNTYIGADVDAVIAALADDDPNNDGEALGAAIGTLMATDYETRMSAFADEIAKARPHVVGLQEITKIVLSQYATGLPADILIDFLPVLLAALDARGLDYDVGASQLNINVSLFGGLVQLQDYDVILYDADRVTWTPVLSKLFAYNVGELAPGVVLNRGWIWGIAEVGGVAYNVVNTHPEAGGEGDLGSDLTWLRYAQIAEIATGLGGASPAIIMGDLNDLPGSPMHQVLIGAGFQDVWAELRPGADGFTAPHLYDLSNRMTQFTKRIDYVFARGLGHPGAGLQGNIYRVGEVPADRIQGPQYMMWPSDHAGLVAQFSAPPANGVW